MQQRTFEEVRESLRGKVILVANRGIPARRIARSIRERFLATAAVTAIAAREGAWGVRVHEVRASADAVRVARAIEGAL